MKNRSYFILIAFIITSCQSPSLIKSIGTPEDLVNNAELQMNSYSQDDAGAHRLAWRSLEEALKIYEKEKNTKGLGDAYHTYGKVNKYFRGDYKLAAEQQRKAISYYKQTDYNPGLAVSYSELAIIKNSLGKKEEACEASRNSIKKFELMKTTHPDVQIPIYNPNFNSVTDLSLAIHKELGCAN